MNFTDAFQQIFSDIGIARKMVLATSMEKVVSARTVSVIILDNKFFFQSDYTMDKAREIAKNDNVALAFDNVQIKGICRDLGHPLANCNERFVKNFKLHYSGAYSKYTHLSKERVYEVTPTIIKLWKYKGDSPSIEILDCKNELYRVIKYDIES